MRRGYRGFLRELARSGSWRAISLQVRTGAAHALRQLFARRHADPVAQFLTHYGADGVRGLLYGDASQLAAQVLSCVVVATFGFVMAYVWFQISNLITPIRVSAETEIEGLDAPEMGVLAYPDFPIHTGSKRMFE